MISEKFDIKGLFGVFGVGTMLILGCFFILNGTLEIWEVIEEASELKGWNIFVSIPLVVVAYLFGIIAIELADLVLYRKDKLIQENLILKLLVEKDNQFLQSLYTESIQTQRLLKGGFIALIFIAIGTFIEGHHWDSIGVLGYIGCIGALALSILCMILSKRIRIKFQNTIEVVISNKAELTKVIGS